MTRGPQRNGGKRFGVAPLHSIRHVPPRLLSRISQLPTMSSLALAAGVVPARAPGAARRASRAPSPASRAVPFRRPSTSAVRLGRASAMAKPAPAFGRARTLRVNASVRTPAALAASSNEVSAEVTVRAMYDAINRRDVEAALAFVDENVLYEDFNFPTPFKGIAAVRKLFEQSCDGIPDDMLFIIDECTDGGGLGVGMTWFVQLEGEPFPNARGASFYKVDAVSGKLIYARDVVEPPAKLGDLSFSIIRAVAPLVKKQLKAQREKREAEEGTTGGSSVQGTTKSVSSVSTKTTPGDPLAAAGLYALGGLYWFVLLLSPVGWQGLPGEPAWAVAPETLAEVVAESTNFFFVLPLLNNFGIDLLGQAPAVHPVTLGVFNFAEAFIFMLLPLLLMDKTRRGHDLPTTKIWSVAMFLTNAAMLPYFAQRAAAGTTGQKTLGETEKTGSFLETTTGQKGLLSKAFGVGGLGIGALSVWWALNAVPEVGGDFSTRVQYLGGLMSSDRVSLAFVVDIVLFSVWQAYMINSLDKEAPAACKYVPFVGLGAWLVL